MSNNFFLKFSSPESTDKHSRLVVSRIKNINSIHFVPDPAGPYLKFNLTDGSAPTCLCTLKDLDRMEELVEELHKIMGPLARFDNPPGIFFNCDNITSFYFMKMGEDYQLNLCYRKGASDCFDMGKLTPEQFMKMPCKEFFE